MRYAALLVALVSIAIGVAGLVSPDGVMSVRQQYVGTPAGLHAAAAVRLAMGLVLISWPPRLLAPPDSCACWER